MLVFKNFTALANDVVNAEGIQEAEIYKSGKVAKPRFGVLLCMLLREINLTVHLI